MHPIVTLQSHIRASAYAKLCHACSLVTENIILAPSEIASTESSTIKEGISVRPYAKLKHNLHFCSLDNPSYGRGK